MFDSVRPRLMASRMEAIAVKTLLSPQRHSTSVRSVILDKFGWRCSIVSWRYENRFGRRSCDSKASRRSTGSYIWREFATASRSNDSTSDATRTCYPTSTGYATARRLDESAATSISGVPCMLKLSRCLLEQMRMHENGWK